MLRSALMKTRPVDFVGLAVGLAGVVDPARRVAAVLGVDDVLVVDVEVEGVVRVVRDRAGGGAAPRFQVMTSPLYSMIRLARGERLEREDALAVHARAAHLDARPPRAGRRRRCWLGRGLACAFDFFGYIEFMGARACVRAREKPGLYGCGTARLAQRPIRPRHHDQVTDHCREALRRAGHRARADARARASSKSTTSTSRATSYIVTSAVGHLLEIKAPEEFDVKRGKWSFAHLPVIPPHFDLNPIDKSKGAAERDRQAGQAQGRERADQRLRRGPRGRADLSPDPAAQPRASTRSSGCGCRA